MAFTITAIIALVALVLTIIELGLTGYLVSVAYGWWGGYGFHDSRAGFMLFCSIWTLLVLIYLLLASTVMARIRHHIVVLVLEGLTMLFWFAGSIALAVLTPATSCNGHHYCDVMKAAVAFGFFLWAAFTALLVMDILAWRRGGSTHTKPSTQYV